MELEGFMDSFGHQRVLIRVQWHLLNFDKAFGRESCIRPVALALSGK